MAKAKRQPKLSAAAQRLLSLAQDARTVEDAAHTIVSKLIEGVECPPTDLRAVGTKLGINEIFAEELPMAGGLRRTNKGLSIAYSASLSLTRRRFTIAHELGHAIFELTGRNCPRTGSEVERICDMLASEMLMPREFFSKAAEGEPIAEKIIDLADTFKASLSAVCIRYAKLKNASIFRASNGQVNWRTGIVRYDPVDIEGSELNSIVSKAVDTPAGTDVIWLNTRTWVGQWRVSWTSLGQQRIILASPIFDLVKRSMVA